MRNKRISIGYLSGIPQFPNQQDKRAGVVRNIIERLGGVVVENPEEEEVDTYVVFFQTVEELK